MESVVREGYAATAIVDEATERGADLIVIGTHGLSGLKHMLLGSIAERVVQKAPCPVLTVKAGRKPLRFWRNAVSDGRRNFAARPKTLVLSPSSLAISLQTVSKK